MRWIKLHSMRRLIRVGSSRWCLRCHVLYCCEACDGGVHLQHHSVAHSRCSTRTRHSIKRDTYHPHLGPAGRVLLEEVQETLSGDDRAHSHLFHCGHELRVLVILHVTERRRRKASSIVVSRSSSSSGDVVTWQWFLTARLTRWQQPVQFISHQRDVTQ